MKVKVCGISDIDNGKQVAQSRPELIGLIFYPGSPRYMRTSISPEEAMSIQASTVGVFVNANLEEVIATVAEYELSVVQLHGDETPEYCAALKETGTDVIKAFSVQTEEDIAGIEKYADVVDFFLFDTKGEKRGGLGVKFNWDVLRNYKGETPYFLSGGIGPDDLAEIKDFDDARLYAIDINSRFETAPGIKDVELVTAFMNKLRS